MKFFVVGIEGFFMHIVDQIFTTSLPLPPPTGVLNDLSI